MNQITGRVSLRAADFAEVCKSLQLPGFELPEALREAQQEFSHTFARMLDNMADRIEGEPPKENLNFEDAVEHLERKVQSCFSKGPSELLAAHLQTLQSLSSRMGSLTISLADEIQRMALH